MHALVKQALQGPVQPVVTVPSRTMVDLYITLAPKVVFGVLAKPPLAVFMYF